MSETDWAQRVKKLPSVCRRTYCKFRFSSALLSSSNSFEMIPLAAQKKKKKHWQEITRKPNCEAVSDVSLETSMTNTIKTVRRKRGFMSVPGRRRQVAGRRM